MRKPQAAGIDGLRLPPLPGCAAGEDRASDIHDEWAACLAKYAGSSTGVRITGPLRGPEDRCGEHQHVHTSGPTIARTFSKTPRIATGAFQDLRKALVVMMFVHCTACSGLPFSAQAPIATPTSRYPAHWLTEETGPDGSLLRMEVAGSYEAIGYALGEWYQDRGFTAQRLSEKEREVAA